MLYKARTESVELQIHFTLDLSFTTTIKIYSNSLYLIFPSHPSEKTKIILYLAYCIFYFILLIYRCMIWKANIQ